MIKKPYIISISANSGGGKTTITKELCKRLRCAQAIYFDDYEYDKQPDNICEWVENGVPPSDWDLSIFVNKIKDLINNESIDYIVLDYPFGRQDYPVKDFINLSIFIDTPLDVTLARRIIRDFKKATVPDIMDDLKFYLERSRPCFTKHSNDMLLSDLVVDGSLTIHEIMEVIISYIEENNLAK